MDKRTHLSAMVAELSPGKSVTFGGSGMQRKPMAAARQIARSKVKGLTAYAFLGGPEIDLLLGAEAIETLHFAYVGFDLFGLSPNFRKARETGGLKVVEYSEATFITGIDAGAKRLPFLPTRFGLGTDILQTATAPFKIIRCPFSDAELVAVPAITPDVAFIHVNVADAQGNGMILGDAFYDAVLARAARKVFLTAERVVERLPTDRPARSTVISRLWVDGVCEVPTGANPTGNYPTYAIDVTHIKEYAKNCADATWLADYVKS